MTLRHLMIVWGLFFWLLMPTCARAAETQGPARADDYFTLSDYAKMRIALADQELKDWTHFQVPADAPLTEGRHTRWARYLKHMLHTPRWLDLGVEFRARYEHMTNPFRRSEFGTDEQAFTRTLARMGLNGGPFRFLVEMIDARAFYHEPGEFQNNTTVDTSDILQLFGSATSENFLSTGLRADVHVGRITMDMGRRRLLARNIFRNTINSFDGAHFMLSRSKVWSLRAFITKPTFRDSTAFNDPYGQAGSLFWGAYYTNQQVSWLQTDLYYFGLQDQNKTVIQRKYSTFGLRLFKNPKVAEFDYEIESDWQVGARGTKDHFAYFQHVEAGYTINRKWQPRPVVLFDYASGTADPNGTYDQTFDTLFGARRWEMTPTGIFGPFFRSNLMYPGAQLFLTPRADVQIYLKYRAWYLAQERDAWVGSALQDSTGSSGNFLGQDVEIRLRWTINVNATLEAGYDHLFKGSYMANIVRRVPGAPPAEDTDYFYLQTQIRF
jgi:hypothetical protein